MSAANLKEQYYNYLISFSHRLMHSVKEIDKIFRNCLHHMTTPHHGTVATVYTSTINEYECYRYHVI